MRFVLYTNALSAHQIPIAKEIVKRIGPDNFRYIYSSNNGQKFQESNTSESWIYYVPEGDFEGWLGDADVVLSGLRCLDMFESRAKSVLKTFYMSERWFKPPIGMLRLLHPRYFNMAMRLVKLMRSEASFTYLPIGIHAARDMARLCGLFAGDLRCLFRAPKLDFERRPGDRIYIREQGIGNGEQNKKYCLDKMRMWGYFVEASRQPSVDSHQCQSQLATNDQQPTTNPPLTTNDYPLTTIKVLWVGRLLNWKRVDTIIRAIGELANLKRVDNSLPKITLDIYGSGPEETRLKKLAAKYDDVIKFYPPVPIVEVRRLMREHDIYVLASNAYEGWGAVVSEALEEGMNVIGTYEAGSSATILPKAQLFFFFFWRRLLKVLTSDNLMFKNIGEWNAKRAAETITSFVGVRDE